MTVISVVPDQQACTLTLTAEYAETVDAVWQLWADPRLLERWWGPPGYPATVVAHDLTVGGRVSYFMTGPDGEKYPGFWAVADADAPRRLQFDDAFGEPDGPPSGMPLTRTHVVVEPIGDNTRMVIVGSFDSAAAMQQLTDLGMLEGLAQAVGQTDELLVGSAQG